MWWIKLTINGVVNRRGRVKPRPHRRSFARVAKPHVTLSTQALATKAHRAALSHAAFDKAACSLRLCRKRLCGQGLRLAHTSACYKVTRTSQNLRPHARILHAGVDCGQALSTTILLDIASINTPHRRLQHESNATSVFSASTNHSRDFTLATDTR